jgi:hypothetical protein
MISRYWQHLASTLIQVPHHGSNTSSSDQQFAGRGVAAVMGNLNKCRRQMLPVAADHRLLFPLRATMRGGCPRTRSFSAIASGGIAGSPRRRRCRRQMLPVAADHRLLRLTFYIAGQQDAGATVIDSHRVDGAAALVSASRYNAWRMPSHKVVQRYRQRGYAASSG